MENSNEFRLTRKQFADSQGISVDLLKKRQKSGKYQNHYVVQNGQYFFRPFKEDGPIKVGSLGKKSPSKRNRGSHFKSTNPNYKPQFKKTNELRMLAKLKHSVDAETQDLLPEAIEIAKQKKRERLQKSLNQPIKQPYTNGIENMSKTYTETLGLMPFSSTPRGTITWKTEIKELNPKPKDEYERYMEENNIQPTTRKLYW